MTTVAVNCESARNGGTRAYLRQLLNGAGPGLFTPVFRTTDGRGFDTSESPVQRADAPMPLAERLRWERRTLATALKALEPDVLLQPSNIGLARKFGIPQVQVLHNVAPLVHPLRSISDGRLLLRFLALRALTQRALEHASGFVFLSHIGEELARRAGFDGRSALIRPGLEMSSSRRPPDPVILVVAHLFRYKRIEDAVHAFCESSLPGCGVRLQIFGGFYDEQYVRDLRRMIARTGSPQLVELLGARPPSEVRDALSRALVVIQPSACENAPQVVYECLAAHIPILCSDIPAHVELVNSGLYPLGDTRRLRHLLEQAVNAGLEVHAVFEPKSWADTAEEVASFCASCAGR